MAAFHEILFPLDIALKSAGGPERKTEIVALGSGREERNARWAHSRRRYDAGYGVKTLDALSQVVAFFEERRGRLYGFRWRDRLFIFLTNLAMDATEFFRIPPNRVVELGGQVEI